MKTIPLTQGKVAIVDDEDFDRLSQFKWCAVKNRLKWYALRAVIINDKQISIWMHREILNVPSGKQTDHKDGNGLNNQRRNLRICSRSQNMANARKYSGTRISNKYKGASWQKNDRNWQAHICKNGKLIYLGHYNTEIEAALVYDKHARELFGEFAHTNFSA
jgi:hypothetical protein